MGSRYQSYLCHSCNTHISVSVTGPIVCPECGSDVFEEIDPHGQFALGRPRLNAVIVLRRPSTGEGVNERDSFEFYYEDNSGSGVQPFPASAAQYLMRSGIISLFDQSSHNRIERSTTLRVAVESLPVITIGSNHVEMDLHCAICTDPFEIDAEGRELPCKHIFHSDCILPWLNLRNSCPVCRYELPLASVVVEESVRDRLSTPNEENPFGLVIWRSPGGGFGVRRFGRGHGFATAAPIPINHAEIETVMDGDFTAIDAENRVVIHREMQTVDAETETEIEGHLSAVGGPSRVVIETEMDTEIEIDIDMDIEIDIEIETRMAGDFSPIIVPRRLTVDTETHTERADDSSAVGAPMRMVWDNNNEDRARESRRRRSLAFRSFLSLFRRFRMGSSRV